MIAVIKITLFVKLSILFSYIIQAASATHLSVTNNGPAVVGANITFFSVLPDYSADSSLTYVFDDGIQKSVSVTSTSSNVSVSMMFTSDQYSEGQYRMNVTVIGEDFVFFKKTIASNFTSFELKRYLIGGIVIYQGNRSIDKDVNEIAVGENFTAAVEIYDPNHFLKDAIIDYSWSFDGDNYITSNNSFVYNFSDVGRKDIIVMPTATFPDSQSVFGYFHTTVTAKIPVNHVNVSGNPFLHHGDFLKLNVSCLGTPPFAYCSKIFKDPVTIENFTCSDISVFTSCHMEIRKFLTDGKYQIGIYIGNDVREVKKLIEVMVYNVSIKPTLSTIIIPIVCSLLTLIIIAIGISLYIQQRNQLAVEVADFDFQDDSDSYAGERTFFEKILDSFACRNCEGNNRWSCVNSRNESDPLLSDDLLPYV